MEYNSWNDARGKIFSPLFLQMHIFVGIPWKRVKGNSNLRYRETNGWSKGMECRMMSIFERISSTEFK